MKLTIVWDGTDEILQFAEQLGVTHLRMSAWDCMTPDQRGPVIRSSLRDQIARARAHHLQIGVALLPQGVGSQHWNIRLGRPEREQEIQDVCESLRVLGGEGVGVVEYVFNLAAVFGSSSVPEGRGGATVRRYDHDEALQAPEEPEFAATEAEVWERITWFLERAVPVAEKAGVKLACHPDDPPVPTLRGETRVVSGWEGMQRLLDIVPSPANGLNFCQGTVAEMGIDVIKAIRTFGGQGKIHQIHFRNIKGTLPRFDESFIDDGDTDMHAALRAYKEVGYTGTIMPDHWPKMIGDSPLHGRAFALGYIKAMMEELGVLEGGAEIGPD